MVKLNKPPCIPLGVQGKDVPTGDIRSLYTVEWIDLSPEEYNSLFDYPFSLNVASEKTSKEDAVL